MVSSCRRITAGFFLAGLLTSCAAFAPTRHIATNQKPSSAIRTTTYSKLDALPNPGDIGDLTSLQHAVQGFATASSTLLSDAAAAAAEETTKDTGWWGSYLQIFRNILVSVHNTVDQPLKNAGIENTWGISIALFTCSIRACLIPLSIQQNKNSEYMKALKPYMNEIKEKFKDNEQAKNAAIGRLFEDANQNPLAGCAVSLIQLPVLLGLYRGIRLLAMEGKLQEPFLWIPSLEGPVGPPDYRGTDWLTSGWTQGLDGYPVPPLGWETTLAFLAMPLLLIALQSFTLNALQPPMDENMSEEEAKTFQQTQLVFKFLPLMLGFFALQVPAGLTIYWVTTNLFTLTQSLAVRAYFAANPPEINLPDYWDTLSSDKKMEDMTPEERRMAVEAGLRVGPTMEDLKTESKFHTYIERQPLRIDSAAWKRIADSEDAVIPNEMQAWVQGDEQEVLKSAAAEATEEKAPTPATA